jgi:hypothetical protein
MSGNLWQVVVNNTLLLVVVDILNIFDFKCENITILSLFVCELWTFKMCVFSVEFLDNFSL